VDARRLRCARAAARGANLLAERAWPRFYDRARLTAIEVPAAALIYANDAYVPRPFSEQTAAQIGGLRTWLTDEYKHNGLRADGDRILDRLLDLPRGHA
jgi:pimeloyl-ACP methyl ester carboxylesterase